MSALWHPQTEADLAASIQEGTLAETHHQDVKRELGAKPSDRKELARDLAQFGLDGGQLVIGVNEDKPNRTWTLAPQPLAEISERIELIARSNITPELNFSIRTFPSADGPGLGYVVVEVPASASAPHMVDGVYYGRGDTTRIRLSDAEVVRWHRSRRNDADRTELLLAEEIARDPFLPHRFEHGHLYLVAEPQVARPGMATDLVRGPSEALQQVVMMTAEEDVHADLRGWAPTPSSASSTAIRADGISFCHRALSHSRTFNPEGGARESNTVDVQINEDGGIRVFVGRLTDVRGDPGETWIMDGLAIAYAVRLAHWAASVSTMTGYASGWAFGIAGNGLRGKSSIAYFNHWGDAGPVYDHDEYRATTTASGAELSNSPGQVAERLVGRLLRGLGTADRYAPHLAHRRPS